jgi:hypothetical protein
VSASAQPLAPPAGAYVTGTSAPIGPVPRVDGPVVCLDARDPAVRWALGQLADRLDARGWTPPGRRLRETVIAYGPA